MGINPIADIASGIAVGFCRRAFDSDAGNFDLAIGLQGGDQGIVAAFGKFLACLDGVGHRADAVDDCEHGRNERAIGFAPAGPAFGQGSFTTFKRMAPLIQKMGTASMDGRGSLIRMPAPARVTSCRAPTALCGHRSASWSTTPSIGREIGICGGAWPTR